MSFTSSLGAGVSIWANKEVPTKNHQYDVEFDIDRSIDEVRDMSVSNVGEYYFKREKNSLITNGRIESIEDDGMAFYRLSQDCLIMIETSNSIVKKGDWVSLKLQYTDIKMTAQGC